MNLYTMDWLVVFFFIAGLLAVGLYTRRYTRSVADFLATQPLCGQIYAPSGSMA